MLEMNAGYWKKKNVFLTGHTGFKGGWLALWLSELGAHVHGYSHPDNKPNGIYSQAGVRDHLKTEIFEDVRDMKALSLAVEKAQPEIVFHLAAQALVRRSYAEPLETISTNVSGTASVLEACRKAKSCKVVIVATSDKCYENKEIDRPYQETDPMGGHDPYSASKGCAELICSSFRRSFLNEKGIGLATVRAGNVIGGGDESPDRLIPDFLRASEKRQQLVVRNPNAIRPWQHVLEALSGYMLLAEKMSDDPKKYADGWNFGPELADCKPVSWVVDRLASRIPGSGWCSEENPNKPHEATFLKLDITKARSELSWQPRWQIENALDEVAHWHKRRLAGDEMQAVSREQIHRFMN